MTLAVADIVNRVLQREGGIADVGDGKGTTYFGQTKDWLDQFNLPTPKTPTDAAKNYAQWLKVTGLEQVVSVADSLADIVVDIAVMSDHRKGIKALQAALKIQVDGVLGPRTLAALAKIDREQLAREVIAWDMEYQGRLITMDPVQRGRYAAGWSSRMAGHVRSLAGPKTALLGGPGGTNAGPVNP